MIYKKIRSLSGQTEEPWTLDQTALEGGYLRKLNEPRIGYARTL